MKLQKETPGSLTKSVNVSLVTYTYNDHGHVAELLSTIRGWTVSPREIVVVDDGSATPFSFDDTFDFPGKNLIRMPKNSGPTKTKNAGLKGASSKYVLSIDADTRLEPDWLAKCLPLLSAGNVGMASSPLIYEAGDSAIAEYLRTTYSYRYESEPVLRIPGPVFLMKRKTLEAIGFLDGHDQPASEDTYLCDRLTKAGYRLAINHDTCAYQTRKMSRFTTVKRGFEWQNKEFIEAAKAGRDFLELVMVFCYGMTKRPAYDLEKVHHIQYFDLLYCLYGVHFLTEFYPGSRAALLGFIQELLTGLDRLHDLLRTDLAGLGIDLTAGSKGDADIFRPIREAFPRPFLEFLDAHCIDLLSGQAESEDYSMYR